LQAQGELGLNVPPVPLASLSCRRCRATSFNSDVLPNHLPHCCSPPVLLSVDLGDLCHVEPLGDS
jgi:hypothetical protein